MANVPRQISREVIPSGRVAGAPIPFDIADTGERIEARGLGQLGAGVSQLGQIASRIEEAEGASQASTAKGQIDNSFRLFQAELKDNNDPTTYKNKFNLWLADTRKFTPENTGGAKRFNDYTAAKIPEWESSTTIQGLAKKKDIIEGAYISNRGQAIRNGDLDETNRLTAEARDTGVITAEQAAKDVIINQVSVQEVLTQNAINSVHAAIQTAADPQTGTGNFDLAKEMVKQSDVIPADQKTTLNNAIRSAQTTFDQKKVTLQETAINLVYEDIAKGLTEDPDNVTLNTLGTDIQRLPQKDQQAIEGVFNRRTIALSQGQPDPFRIHNPSVFSTIQRTLELDAKSMTPTQIFSFVGGGIEPVDFTALNDFRTFALTKDSPLQQPDVKDAFGLVNSFKRLSGIPADADDVFKINDFENKAKQRITEQVQEGVRGKELEDFTANMLAPVTESAVGNWLGNFYRGTFPQFLGGNVPGLGDRKDMISAQRFKQPGNVREFEAFTNEIASLFGDEEGRSYYNLWKGDFE